MAEREIDELSGTETTGHVWDGNLKELNNPLPKWWIYVFYITIIWSIGYYIVFPAWPLASDYTKGVLDWSSREEVREELQAARTKMSERLEALRTASLEEIRSKPELLNFAMAAGKAAFGDNCSPCHGTGAQGGVGYPNLNDDDWLWGGTLEAINYTLTHGVRYQGDDETRVNEMPAFGKDELLDKQQIIDVAGYVLSLSGGSVEGADVAKGKEIFAENCAACHGEDAKGSTDLGAPNLTDAIWLYGGTPEKVIETITNSRRGVMPAWGGRLDETTIKALTVFVHSLGGGVQE